MRLIYSEVDNLNLDRKLCSFSSADYNSQVSFPSFSLANKNLKAYIYGSISKAVLQVCSLILIMKNKGFTAASDSAFFLPFSYLLGLG